jgi:hypothetical protein
VDAIASKAAEHGSGDLEASRVLGAYEQQLGYGFCGFPDLLRARVAATSEGDPTLGVLVAALRGVLEAAVALTDPEVVVFGGAWGRDPAVVGALRRRMVDLPRAVDVVPACLADQPQLAGARAAALEQLREVIVTTIRSPA